DHEEHEGGPASCWDLSISHPVQAKWNQERTASVSAMPFFVAFVIFVVELISLPRMAGGEFLSRMIWRLDGGGSNPCLTSHLLNSLRHAMAMGRVRMIARRIVPWLVAVGLMTLLVRRVGGEEIMRAFAQADVGYLLLWTLICTALNFSLDAY